MVTPPAWADYLDARLRLIHEWTDEGLSPIDIAERLSPTAVEVLRIAEVPTEPALPGCSRDQVTRLRARVERLEAELRRRLAPVDSEPPPSPRPPLSGFFPKT